MLYKHLNFAKTSVMKKLITLSFFFFFVLVGNTQVTNVTVVDISNAVKVADFPDVAKGSIEKYDNQYYSLVRGHPSGLHGYHRKDTIGSQWEFVDFPDSIIIRETLFINGKWLGFEHDFEPCRYDQSGLATCFLHTLGIYHFDFAAAALIPIDTLKNCGPSASPTISKTGENLFISFPTSCIRNQETEFYSNDGLNWTPFDSNNLFQHKTTGEKYVNIDFDKKMFFLSDSITFTHIDTVYLPDSIDWNPRTFIYEFQDSTYIFFGYENYFLKTGDLENTWKSVPFLHQIRGSVIFNDGNVFFGSSRDALAYSIKDNVYFSILPDSLLFPFSGFSVSTDLHFYKNEIVRKHPSKII